MKALRNLFIVLALFLAYESMGQTEMLKAKDAGPTVAPIFDVDLVVYKSEVKGDYLAAVIRTTKGFKDVRYSYRWVVNGQPAGKTHIIPYPHAKSVKVYVTQLPRGRMVMKSLHPEK